MDFEIEKVFQAVWTRTDAEIMMGYIDTLSDSLYGLDNKSFESVAGKIPEDKMSLVLLAEIRKRPEDLRQGYLRELSEFVKSCEIMTLTVAINLSRDTIEEIVESLRSKWGKLVLDLQIDPKIVGGAKISWRGKYFEKTLYDQI